MEIKTTVQNMTVTNLHNENRQIPLVSIIFLVYNQAKYLRQAIEGLLMQRTSFLYEIIVHDDASTDDSKKIIEEYVFNFPQIINPIYQKENKYSVYGINYVIKYAVSKSEGKYIAMCAGDDYWIDPRKLQKQVDILESNSDVGLIHTKAVKFDQESSKFNGFSGFRVESLKELLTENTIAALTVCIQRALLIQYYDEVKPHKRPNWPTEDFPAWAWVLQNSKIKFLDEYTAVYRSREGSVSHILDDVKRLTFSEGIYDIVDYYLSYIGNIEDENKIRARYYSNMINMYFLVKGWDGVRNSAKIFYKAKDWLNLLWIVLTIPFFYSRFMIKASYRVRSIIFDLFNIYPIKK